MLIDIDHFKSFNDSYGHTTGDAVLASFARSISKWCNGKFYSARYGGEEFAIILTGNSSHTLAQLAANARAFISEQVIGHEDLQLSITASAGLTTIQEGDTIKRVYERADEGLYRSKKAGRNRGHWLDTGEWKAFPRASGSELKPNETVPIEAAKATPPKCIDETAQAIATSAVTMPHSPESTQINVDDSDLLDLGAFVDRIETQLKQLSRADMPAAAIMLEAVGLTPETVRDFAQAWSEVLEIVQSNLRGIDLICRIRQNTLCVFMPGCTLNGTLERAGGMQHMLEERKSNGVARYYPERFAIATASTQRNETAGVFLQRLEDALDEAQDAGPLELVVSEATSSYFHAT